MVGYEQLSAAEDLLQSSEREASRAQAQNFWQFSFSFLKTTVVVS